MAQRPASTHREPQDLSGYLELVVGVAAVRVALELAAESELGAGLALPLVSVGSELVVVESTTALLAFYASRTNQH